MTQTASPEFSFTIDVDRIPAGGGLYEIAAPAAALAPIAARLGVIAVEALTARFTVKAGVGGIVQVDGAVRTKLVQSCVVTLAPVPAALEDTISASFITDDRLARNAKKAKAAAKGAKGTKEEDEELVDLHGEDPPELVTDGRIDLGELAVAQVALVLEPYPRAPGVSFQAPARPAGAEEDESIPDGAVTGPFAALAKLKKNLPN